MGLEESNGHDDLAYPFDASFQRRIFAAVLRDQTFLRRFGEIIKASYFTDERCRRGMEIVEKFYSEFRSAPSIDTLRQLVNDDLARRNAKRDVQKVWENFLNELDTLEERNIVFVERRAADWAKDQVFAKFVEDAAKLVDETRRTGERTYDKARDMLRLALAVGTARDDRLADYFPSTAERMRYYAALGKNKIATFCFTFDRILDGGLDRGEEAVLVGPPGRGKSSSLIQFGVLGGLLSGLDVLVVSAEMSQIKLQMRVDRCLTGLTKTEISDDPEEARERLKMIERFKGRLRVYDFPARKCTIEMINNLIERLKNTEGFVPSVLVVDYAAILAPSHRYSEKRFEIGDLYRELRDLGREWELAVWTAAQSNRGSFSKAIVTMADLAECWDIAAIVDVMVCLCQTEAERSEGRYRLYVAKNRDAEDHRILDFVFDRQRSRFSPVSVEAV